MLARAKGLSVHVGSRDVSISAKSVKDTENNSKKESGLKIENKENGAKLLSKSSKVSSLKIFQDASSTVCQHCGVEKSLRSQDAIKCDASIQASENMATQLKDMLCAETPSVDYWMDLAEQRRMALVEALSENKELCDLVEKLTAELDRLSEVEKKAEEFTQALQELKKREEDANSEEIQ